MLNQHVSINDTDRPAHHPTALSPLPSDVGTWAVDPDLAARLTRAAAAFGLPSPDVIPGAAVLLLAIDLPLKSARKRSAAAAFAAEPHLAEMLDEMHVAVGSRLHDHTRLCAAASLADLNRLVSPYDHAGCVIPDLCAVPLPTRADMWSIWCGPHSVYVRNHDGTGCVLARDSFADVWRGLGRPPVELWHGTPPPGIDVASQPEDMPAIDRTLFQLDMRPETSRSHRPWRGRIGFAASLVALASAAHAAILYADAQVLDRLAADRGAAITSHVATRGGALDLDMPLQVIAAELARSTTDARPVDQFLALLAQTGTALAGQSNVQFRDLQFDAGTGTLVILINAPDLASLQKTEDALRTVGLTVQSGAASTNTTGAEMQLILTEST